MFTTGIASSTATVLGSPSRCLTYSYSSSQLEYQNIPVVRRQNLACIRLELGEGSSTAVFISISRGVHNSAYSNYPTLSSQNDSDQQLYDVPNLLVQQESSSEVLLISFSKCSKNLCVMSTDQNGSSKDSDMCHAPLSYLKPATIQVDLENECCKTVLIPSDNVECSKMSACCFSNVDPSGNSQDHTPKSQKLLYHHHPIYINLKGEDESSSSKETLHI